MRKLLAFLLLLCLTLPCATAEEPEEELYIEVEDVMLDEDGNEIQEESEPVSIFEEDGSILLTMTFTGDFTIGKSTGRDRFDYFGDELAQHGGDINYTMDNMRAILQADDMTLVNFEGTLTNSTYIPANKKENHFLFSAPPEWASILPDNGIECASLENNHVMDHGEEAYEDTKAALREAGVVYSNSTEMGVYTCKGIDICMLSYLCIDRYDKSVGGYATLYDKVAADIRAAKELYPIVITSFHWGNEKDYFPTERQIRMGRLAVDSGADLVIGHHSHRMNPIECYKGVYICYSLGNFCFAGHKKPDDMTSFVFQTRFRERNGEITNEGFRIIPIRISSLEKRNDFIPTPLEKAEHIDSVLTTLKQATRDAGKKKATTLTYAVETYPLTWEN